MSDGPLPKKGDPEENNAKRRAKKMAKESEEKKDEPSERAKKLAALRKRAIKEAARQEGTDATYGLDKRKKSRNKEILERATESAKVEPATEHTLDVMDDGAMVTEMARSGAEPDWGDNPAGLGNPMEVREDLREDGLDPMDVDSKEEALYGHFLTHAFADDPDRGGRSPQQLEAEHDMVVEKMEKFGVDHDSPLDLGDIEGGESVGDPFGVGIDMDLGGEL